MITPATLFLTICCAFCAQAQPDDPIVSVDGSKVSIRADRLVDLRQLIPQPHRVRELTIVPVNEIRPELDSLKLLRSLQTLNCSGVAIADEDLAVLAHLPDLKSLNLSRTPVFDRAVYDHLHKLKSLRELDLSSTAVSNASLPCLGEMTGLKRLALCGTRISTPSLGGRSPTFASLEPLQELEELDIQVTLHDDDLLSLSKLKSLKSLTLGRSTGLITVDGLFALKEKAPKVSVAAQILERSHVTYDIDEKGRITKLLRCLPALIVRLAKVEPLDHVHTLHLVHSPTNDLIASLPNVRSLTIERHAITRDIIATISQWRRLLIPALPNDLSWFEAGAG